MKRTIMAGLVVVSMVFGGMGCDHSPSPTSPSTSSDRNTIYVRQVPFSAGTMQSAYARVVQIVVRYNIAPQDRDRIGVLISCLSLDGINVIEGTCFYATNLNKNNSDIANTGVGGTCELSWQGVTSTNFIIHILAPGLPGQFSGTNSVSRVVQQVVRQHIVFSHNSFCDG